MEEIDKLKMEINLLDNSMEINKFNYNLSTSIFLTGLVIIFTLVQIVMEIFSSGNKLYYLIGGLICYVCFAFYMNLVKFSPEDKWFTAKYNLMKEKYEELGLNISKLENDIRKIKS